MAQRPWARDAVDVALGRIALLNPSINAVTATYPDAAKKRAVTLDDQRASGRGLGPLYGVPYLLKDLTPSAGQIATRGSVAFEAAVGDTDPPLVKRLASAGAVLVGRATTAELAHSSFTRSLLHGVTRNPWNLEHTSGGSSGGSAAAVAAGMVPLAEGSDAGGSVRIPASCCGVVGFKPSLGRVPTQGIGAHFETIFQHGLLTRTVSDCLTAFRVIQGHDVADPLSFPTPFPAVGDLADCSLSDVTVAFSVDLGFYEVHPRIAAATRAVAQQLATAGATVQEVRLSWGREIVDAWTAYWGVFLAARYGHLLSSHQSRMDPALVRLLRTGSEMLAVDFKRIDDLRLRLWDSMMTVLDPADVLLCPTLAVPVPPATGLDDDDFTTDSPSGRLRGLDMTCPFNLVPACPAVSVPSGFDEVGLPTGVQFVGRPFDDVRVLGLAAAVEELLPWPSPPMAASTPKDAANTSQGEVTR